MAETQQAHFVFYQKFPTVVSVEGQPTRAIQVWRFGPSGVNAWVVAKDRVDAMLSRLEGLQPL